MNSAFIFEVMVRKPFFDFSNLYSGDIHMSSTLHQLLYLSWWDYHDHGRFTRMKQQQWVTSIEFGQFDSGLGGCGWDISWEDGRSVCGKESYRSV